MDHISAKLIIEYKFGIVEIAMTVYKLKSFTAVISYPTTAEIKKNQQQS